MISTLDVVLNSLAVTAPFPLNVNVKSADSESCNLKTNAFKLKITSKTSSTALSIGENSCSTPSITREVIAAPSKEDNNTRLNELPIVGPIPGGSGETTKDPVDSSTFLNCTLALDLVIVNS